eukprot:IDg11793t1
MVLYVFERFLALPFYEGHDTAHKRQRHPKSSCSQPARRVQDVRSRSVRKTRIYQCYRHRSARHHHSRGTCAVLECSPSDAFKKLYDQKPSLV